MTASEQKRVLTACEAVLAAIEAQATDTIWILPPYQGAGVHESVVERLQDAIEILREDKYPEHEPAYLVLHEPTTAEEHNKFPNGRFA